MRLEKIGRISHMSKSGFIVVVGDSKKIPKIGSEVYNRRMERIGHVYDIIGPVKSPFILIRPKKNVLKKILPEDLFVLGGEDHGRRKGEGDRKGKGKRGRGKGDRKRGGN